MTEDANGSVRITNADIYRGLEALRTEVGTRFDQLARDDRARWETNAMELSKMRTSMTRWKAGISVGFLVALGQALEIIRRFGLPWSPTP